MVSMLDLAELNRGEGPPGRESLVGNLLDDDGDPSSLIRYRISRCGSSIRRSMKSFCERSNAWALPWALKLTEYSYGDSCCHTCLAGWIVWRICSYSWPPPIYGEYLADEHVKAWWYLLQIRWYILLSRGSCQKMVVVWKTIGSVKAAWAQRRTHTGEAQPSIIELKIEVRMHRTKREPPRSVCASFIVFLFE